MFRLRNIFGKAAAPAVARPRVRLVVIQGPQQFLAATAAIRHQRAIEGGPDVPNIAVVGHFYSKPSENAKMRSVCEDIARHCGYARIVDIEDIEQGLRGRKLSFAAAVRRVRERLGVVAVDTVYVARNGQSLNELGLAVAGEEARRIAYGDSLGWVDLDRSWGERIYNPKGYARISEAWLTTPVEEEAGLFDRLRTVVVPAECYADTISFLCSRVTALSSLRQHFQMLSGGAPTTLCLTGIMTESGTTVSVDDELALYEATARPLLHQDEAVLIKGHPRAYSRQAQRLAEHLRSRGINAVFSQVELPWPAEFLSQFLTFDRVVGFCSSSVVTLAWFQRRPTQIGLDLEVMRRHLPPERALSLTRYLHVLRLLVRQAFTGQFSPIRYDDIGDPERELGAHSQFLQPKDTHSLH